MQQQSECPCLLNRAIDTASMHAYLDVAIFNEAQKYGISLKKACKTLEILCSEKELASSPTTHDTRGNITQI